MFKLSEVMEGGGGDGLDDVVVEDEGAEGVETVKVVLDQLLQLISSQI